SEAVRQQFAFIKRRNELLREAGRKEGRPEAIAGAREVMTDGRGVKARINAAKEHAQARRDYVRHSLAFSCKQLLFSWLPGCSDNLTGNATQLTSKRLCCEALFFETRSTTVTCKRYRPAGNPFNETSAA